MCCFINVNPQGDFGIQSNCGTDTLEEEKLGPQRASDSPQPHSIGVKAQVFVQLMGKADEVNSWVQRQEGLGGSTRWWEGLPVWNKDKHTPQQLRHFTFGSITPKLLSSQHS